MNAADAAPAAVTRALDCVTIASPAPEQLAALFESVLGWRCIVRGAIDTALERHWGIDPGSAGAEYSIWQAGDVARGRVRLVHGGERPRTKPVLARWAGIEMIVSRDIDALYERVRRLPGLTTLQAPVTMDWSEFGSNQHRAFVLLGPGGTHLAFTMGITPPAGRDFPTNEAWAGHVFELPLITAQFERATGWYRGALGLEPILTSQFDGGLWHHIWQLPEPLPVRLDILKGAASGTGLGGIELTGYPDSVIDTQGAETRRLDGGCCLVTLTSHRLDEAYDRACQHPEVRTWSPPAPIDAPGYDGRRAFCAVGPDGERLEFLEEL